MQAQSIATSLRDPDQYCRLLGPRGCEFTVTEAGEFKADYCQVELPRVSIRRGVEIRARIFEGAALEQRDGLTVQLRSGPPMYASGKRIDMDSVGLISASSSAFCSRLSGSTEWASISMARDTWLTNGISLVGREPNFTSLQPAHEPPKPALEKLRRLLRSITRLCAEAPGFLENSEVVRSMDNALVEAAVGCAIYAPYTDPPETARNHARAMRQFAELAERNAGTSLFLPELCLALGVSARTLRNYCLDYFGIPPKRYLLLRRLHLARRALLMAKPGEVSVTSIATRFGFWELGRFSVTYRTMFGEPPNATLKKKPCESEDAQAWYRLHRKMGFVGAALLAVIAAC